MWAQFSSFFSFTDFQAYHFSRDDIYLPGFHKFFKESAEEEMKHAQKVDFTRLGVDRKQYFVLSAKQRSST